MLATLLRKLGLTRKETEEAPKQEASAPPARPINLRRELANRRLTREQFFALYKDVVVQRLKPRAVDEISAGEFRITFDDQEPMTVYLENIWRSSRSAELDVRVDLFEKMLDLPTADIDSPPVTIDSIVPTIKSAEYVAEFGEKTVCEHFVGDLWIAYANDLPDKLLFLMRSELDGLKLGFDKLRAVALENLIRILPEVERHGSGPAYVITAGGLYTASLLLLDFVWDDVQAVVEGDIIAVVPTRDVLLVTGSDSREGIESVSREARESIATGGYGISTTLLRRREGKWLVFE